MASAVIVAAGRGTRMGSDKLFLEVGGLPVVGHAWKRFDAHPDIEEVVLVVRPDNRSAFEKLAVRLDLKRPYTLADGGAERQDSVLSGLQAVRAGAGIVAIHDGARPCTDELTISDVIAAARKQGAAVAASAVVDTLKLSDCHLNISRNIDRTHLWAVQTPQVFRLEIISEAMNAVREQNATVTDDTAACELIGQAVALVPSHALNPKVTTRLTCRWWNSCSANNLALPSLSAPLG